jgi:flagellar biosynthetic protein FliQ
MTPETVIDLLRRALEMGALMAAPSILLVLVTGLAVSVLQATTQVNDANLAFVPKLIAVFLALVFFGPWMLELYVDFTRRIFLELPTLIGLGA